MISIIIATYNSANTIEKCLSSIISQDSNLYEIIIIDGNSTDETIAKIKRYNKNIAYFISENDNGIYDAWNKGITHAKGDWIMFVGSDDYLYNSNVIKDLQLQLLNIQQSSIKIVYTKVNVIDSNDKLINILGSSWKDSKPKMQITMSIPHPGTLHHKSLFNEFGGFNSNFKIAGDYDFILRVIKKYEAAFIPSITSIIMKIGGLSTNKKYYLKLVLEEYKARKINGIKKINILMIKRILYGLYLKF